MFDRLTPIVKHLLLANVVIYVALLVLPKNIYQDFFLLHKSNLLGFRSEVNLDGQSYFLPRSIPLNRGGEAFEMTPDNAEAVIEESPQLAEELARYLPEADRFSPLQIVTSFFAHDLNGFTHILFNMLMLAGLGPILEMVLGPKRFLRFYLFCGVFAGILLAFVDPSPVPVVGASTALSGVLVAFAFFFPKEKLSFMFIPVGIEARWFVLGFASISAILILLDLAGSHIGGSVSHFGHLAGMISAALYYSFEKYLPFK
ncbi:MAG: rhomboid family intramembrane serine protease [Bacteroidetes bacterium]|nr:MAG: rhomboid family intramembrane serine protease [Bacteroidota bacterium]